ncbi:MAG: hypothetical protein ABIR37_02420 [Candidatus Saccharimonadales bacterium]
MSSSGKKRKKKTPAFWAGLFIITTSIIAYLVVALNPNHSDATEPFAALFIGMLVSVAICSVIKWCRDISKASKRRAELRKAAREYEREQARK